MKSLLALTLLLVVPSICFSVPPPVEFIGIQDGFGIKQLKAGGVPLLIDDAAGFYLIGSATGIDDRYNIASFVPGNNGLMRSMNGDPRASIPYTFKLKPDKHDPTKVYFDVTIGPATMQMATISMPLEAHRQLFERYRFEGATADGRYEKNSEHYTPPNRGQYNLAFAPGYPKWGEMIGPDYTLRVTLSKRSRQMRLGFVDAPSLSTGVRNVEFSFGGFKVGEQATASGYVQVLKTPAPLSK